MIEVRLMLDVASFGRRIVFLKDDEIISSFNYELLDDLTFKSPSNNPFKGPELLKNDLMFELATMVINDNLEKLKDVKLDEIIELFRPIVENYKIKSWHTQRNNKMKLILRHNWCDPYVASGTDIIPFEYESKKKAIDDFESKALCAESFFTFLGKEFCMNDVDDVAILTLDEWFDQNKVL